MIRTWREQKGVSQKKLGLVVGVTRQTIAAWEKRERAPSAMQLGKIAEELGVSLDLLVGQQTGTGTSLLFRADAPAVLSGELCRLLTRKAEDYAAVEKLSGSFPVIPASRPWVGDNSGFIEEAAREIRCWLGAESAPLGDVLTLLEAKGLKIIPQDLPNEVSGLSAYTEDLGGVIFVNSCHTPERQFFTGLHELAHLIFHRKEYSVPSGNTAENDPRERMANGIAGAVLLPRHLVERELKPYRNRWIPAPLLGDLKNRYSVGMRTILQRAEQVGIISRGQMEKQLGKITAEFGADGEDYQLPRPCAVRRLERLVFLALAEEKITASQAADILETSLVEVENRLGLWIG